MFHVLTHELADHISGSNDFIFCLRHWQLPEIRMSVGVTTYCVTAHHNIVQLSLAKGNPFTLVLDSREVGLDKGMGRPAPNWCGVYVKRHMNAEFIKQIECFMPGSVIVIEAKEGNLSFCRQVFV